MTKKNHSIGLKLFIFFLVAMMLFSAIGVMVIYLNAPTNTMVPINNVPTAQPAPAPVTIPEGTPSEEAPMGEAIEGTQQPTTPTEELPSEDAAVDAPEAITPPADAELPPTDQNDVE